MSILDYFFGKKAPTIAPAEAWRRLQEEEPGPLLLDVRQPVETRSGMAPGAINVPLTELGSRLEELPRNRPLLTICASNHRSPLAARRLQKAGFDVTDVAGGMQRWAAEGLPVDREGS